MTRMLFQQPATVRHLDLRNIPDIASVKSAENSDLAKPRVFFGARVLLAEDNSLNQKLVMEMLKLLGCHVQVASNGQEALDALAVSMFDLILMDCQMPVMDGYEATHLIREKEARESTDLQGQGQATRRMPIIALTANAMQGDRERCLGAGMDDYLSKPFKLDGLSTMLKRWLPLISDTGFSLTAGAGAEPAFEGPDNKDSTGAPEAGFNANHVDFKAIESIRMLQRSGMPDMLSKVIGIYLRDTPKLLENARKAVDRNDADAMGKQAHSMKSSSATLGALALAELCKEMEAMGRSGTTENAAVLLTRMEAEYAHVARILSRELGSG